MASLVGGVSLSSSRAQAKGDEEAQASEVVITEKARRHFRAGVNFTNDPDGAKYADALREFKLAYQESPSWKILGNLGIAAMKLERDGEAIEAFKTYLAEGGDEIDESERAQVGRDLETLESSVTWLTLKVQPSGARLLDRRIPLSGDEVVNVYVLDQGEIRLGLHAGRHRFTIELDGYEPMDWSFEAEGGTLEKDISLQKVVEKKDAPPAEDGGPELVSERPIPWGVWAGVGVTGAFAVGATVTGILATNKRSQYDEANDGTDPDGARDLKESGQTLNLVTDIMIGGAVVAAGVSAVLYATRPEVTREVGRIRFVPTAYSGGGGLWMQGNF